MDTTPTADRTRPPAPVRPPRADADPAGIARGRTARPDADAVVLVDDLRCSYGTHEAVRGIDLAVRRGEVFALLGTNGAGKTTTLETLEGHRRPTGGQVRVLGRDPHRDRRRLAGRVAALLQDPATPDELTPAETLDLWQRLHPGRAGEPVDALLVRVDLAHRRDLPVRHLSGGERRRLDLAVALAMRPELLLLDEPTTGLDPESRVRTWETIRAVVAAGATVLLTTHYLEEAEALADRLAIMHDGRIAVSGTLEELRARHPARIRCRLPDTAPPLPPLVGEARRSGGALDVTTRGLQADLTALLGWAAEHEIVLERLHAAEPTVAEVFHDVRTAPTTGGAAR